MVEMKILFWKHTAHLLSGSDQQLFSYAAQLQTAGHSPSVLLLYEQPCELAGPIWSLLSLQFGVLARLREMGVPVEAVANLSLPQALLRIKKWLALLPLLCRLAPGLSLKPFIYWSVAHILSRWRPDVVHVLDPREGRLEVLRAARDLGVPTLYHELRTPNDPYTPEASGWYSQMDESLGLCTAVAALSPRHAQLCREQFGYHGPVSILPLMAEPPIETPKAGGQPSGDVIFGYAGIIHRAKGLGVLLEAMALLLRDFPRAQLRLAGWGAHLEDFKMQAHALGISARCEFVGAYFNSEQRSDFLQSLDVFVLPSFTEGTPNSIAEAMAHGLPVVASAVGGIPDMVTPEIGALVSPGDIESLAATLLRFARNPGLRTGQGIAARKRYERFFSPEAVLPLLLDTYLRLAHKNGMSLTSAAGISSCPHPWAEPPSGCGLTEMGQ